MKNLNKKKIVIDINMFYLIIIFKNYLKMKMEILNFNSSGSNNLKIQII